MCYHAIAQGADERARATCWRCERARCSEWVAQGGQRRRRRPWLRPSAAACLCFSRSNAVVVLIAARQRSEAANTGRHPDSRGHARRSGGFRSPSAIREQTPENGRSRPGGTARILRWCCSVLKRSKPGS